MLNGKFFTGLPPKMIDRNSSAANRLESHFFWPDDTKAESAVETRVRRRASLNLEPAERPRLQSQVSLGGQSEVDTKQRFHKEFAKSSIQFYDDIQEEGAAPSQYARRSTLRTARPMKQELAIKPTATKLQLLENAMDERVDRTAKQKQAFNSKIQFYDFEEEDLGKQNNARKPKMDMNNKKEVERNTKNSPKLQVKRNVRHLSGSEERRNNNDRAREQYTPERGFEDGGADDLRAPTQGLIRNPVHEQWQYEEEHSYEAAEQQSPPPSTFRANRNKKFSNSELNLAYNSGRDRYEVDARSNNNYAAGRNSPRKILKNTAASEKFGNDFANAVDEDFMDMNAVEQGVRNVRLRSSPKKHVSYRDEAYENDSPERQHHSDDGMTTSRTTHVNRISTTAHSNRPSTKPTNATNMRTGSNQQRQHFAGAHTPPAPDYELEQTTEVLSQYMETGSGAAKKLFNNYSSSSSSNNIYNNIYSRNNNNKSNNNKQHNEPSQSPLTRRKITPKTSAAADAEAAAAAADAKKHLRSSLCFHDGAIVADNQAASNTPTFSGAQRRNARNSTQRVSVGLPD